MSSSSSPSATAPASRSPSPSTPEAGVIDTLAIQSDAELTSWFITSDIPIDVHQTWSESIFSPPQSKSADDCMLPLDDIIEPHAYHGAPSPCTSSWQISSPQPHIVQLCGKSIPEERTAVQDLQTSNFFVASRNAPLTLTKPEPPPAPLPRKPDLASLNNRIVSPPKDSCLNFPLIFPSIPDGGTKSRVETQVRVTVDLADPSSITEPYKYDRVGSWQWLKLPPGTATKRRTRKQGKIDPSPQDTLYLQAYVICASPPNNRVLSCTSCQTREAKRVAKKLAARVRPARSDSDSIGDPSHPPKHHEDTTSIIQFNCAEVLEFSTGSVILPLRITCYCRHHREKVGFLVNMQMLDHTGRVVACGQTRPIMITDDHKTTATLQARSGDFNTETGWPQLTTIAHNVSINESSTSGRNNRRGIGSPVTAKKRPKPYDTKSKPPRPSREGSASTPASPSTSYSGLPSTRSSTPCNLISQLLTPDTLLSLAALREVGGPSGCPSPDISASNFNKTSDVLSENDLTTTPGPTIEPPNLTMAPTHPMPLMFFDPAGIPQLSPGLAPTIHRLIPNTGPTHGGIEVTVLGANFRANEQLTCVFGGIPACSTQRWSDNALVCILPPRSAPGVVVVWVDRYQEAQPNAPTSLFTYSDETDRTLMELALQVVGLKMTGKIEDAKDVAMRIVGSAGETTETQADNPSMMQIAMANPASTRNILPLLLNSGRETENFEALIINFLKLLDTPLEGITSRSMQTIDVISHTSTTGQTLLHYAAFLGFDSLSKLLVSHKVDIDARDKNGFTALHFAALSGSVDCIQSLLEAGADRDIVNGVGKTPAEIAHRNVLRLLQAPLYDSDDDGLSASDEEAVWGDGEEDASVQVPRRPLRRLSRRNSKRNVALQPLTSAHLEMSSLTPPQPTSEKSQSGGPKGQAQQQAGVDLKQTAWLTEVLQRTLAQLQAPQGIISNIPQLPLPNLPHLSDLRTVQWNSLTQIPVVFPIFVPMPGWPSFLQGNNNDKDQTEAAGRGMSAGALQELRAMFDKWVAIVGATATNQASQNQPLDDTPPPKYTPRAEAEGSKVVGESSSSNHADPASNRPEANMAQPVTPSEIRPVDYMRVPLTDQEVNAYAYAPSTKQVQKLQKKRDLMLLVFWLPILSLSCIWAFYSFVVVAFQAVKTFLPLKTPLRG
ncbi:hypothetical protein JOM56_002051 [Amanita muscaria]